MTQVRLPSQCSRSNLWDGVGVSRGKKWSEVRNTRADFWSISPRLIQNNKVFFFFPLPDPSEYHVDDQCMVQMLKGLCLRHLGRLDQAQLCFTQVISR